MSDFLEKVPVEGVAAWYRRLGQEIEGDNYRLKEAKERAAQRSTSRKEKKSAA